MTDRNNINIYKFNRIKFGSLKANYRDKVVRLLEMKEEEMGVLPEE